MSKDNINRDYVKNIFGTIMKKSEQDPVMLEKMAMMGALYEVTNDEAKEYERNRIKKNRQDDDDELEYPF